MDVFDFNFIVLPLGVMVFVLVAVVLFVVKRKEIEQEQKVRQIASYTKEKSKKRQLMERELAHLDELFEDESIDEDTRERLKFLVKMNKEDAEIEILRKLTKKK